ncbi:ABC transporter substrate-binding protein [soil metagenome]
MMRSRWRGALAVGFASMLVLGACGGSDSDGASSDGGSGTTAADGGGDSGGFTLACSETTPEASGDAAPIKLQLQWFTQAQFAGYYAALDQGFYEDMGLDVEIVEGGTDIVPQTVLADGDADFAIAWVPKALQSIEAGAGITDISQVFQRSGTLQVSWADSDITTAKDLDGKKVGNWGFGNEFELFAGITKAGLDPATDVTLVQQDFDMKALLNNDIDAAQAMTYNEYAQVLEAVNPDTGELYTEDDFNVINWNDEGTAMLQDAIWANTEQLTSDKEYCDNAVRFTAASLEGWAYCRDNADDCVKGVLDKGSQLGESHQAWQMNEINKLIWPSHADGAGTVEKDLWDQTVEVAKGTKNADGTTVITDDPPESAYTGDVNAKALELLKAKDVDVVGDDFEAATIELKEGGE